ncbi:hypothetical protein LCGC14_0231720 [marine sediment metagenome]|uniref:Uncharacterized protein n=1 Tax=marine sediment metagenome TaxID=412755 RepID=A0A0F9UEH0_9ZZZZ
MDIKEFGDMLQINPNDLDTELIRQPELFFRVGQAHALAISERDGAKEDLAVTDASLNFEVRNALEKEGTKATMDLVAAEVQAHKDHGADMQAYLETKRKADELGALRDAFSQRAYMLREMVNLFMANYFATESVSRGEAGERVAQRNIRVATEERKKRPPLKRRRNK